MCHELIFGEIPPPAVSAYPGLSRQFLPQFLRKKVKPRLYPAIIGVSMVFAGSPGLPALSRVMGEVAVEQGRIDRQGRDVKSLERYEDDLARGKAVSTYEPVIEDDEIDSPLEFADAKDAEAPEHSPKPSSGVNPENGIAGSQQRKVNRAVRTSPDLSFPRKEDRLPRFSDDPLGQLDPITPLGATQSVPSFLAGKRSHQPSYSNASEALLKKYDFGSQIHLLRYHFCRSEVCKHLLVSISY